MLFNSNDNHLHPISRDNYEEYFILYADNELSEQDRLAVKAFVLAHPDLQAELELFLSTKLPVENIYLKNKEALLADSMKLNAFDESLLLYIDNELSVAERKLLEEKLVSDKTLELQYKALLKTKLEPEEILYPNKKELYHHKERRFVFSAYWMRIAAAVIILLGMGIFLFTYEPKPDNGVAVSPAKTNKKNSPSTEPSREDVTVTPEKQSVEPTITIGKTDDVPNITRDIEKKSFRKNNKIAKTQEKPSIVAEQNIAVKTIEGKKPAQKLDVSSDNNPAIVQQQTINNKNVTTPPITSLNNQTTDDVAAVHASVIEPNDEKKSKLKGFLRKATRFIERRTNVSTTNENNELLIGAVAIQL